MHEMAEDLKVLLMKDIACVLEKGVIDDYEGLYKAVKTFYYLTIIKEMEEGNNTPAFYEEMTSGRVMPRYNYNMRASGDYPMNSYMDGYSAERGRSPRTGRYISRDMDPTIEKLNHMMAAAPTEEERNLIHRMIDEATR